MKNALRWILVLPAWFLIFLLGPILLGIGSVVASIFTGAEGVGPIPTAITCAIGAYGSVFIGFLVAPSHRNLAASILAGIGILASVVEVVFAVRFGVIDIGTVARDVGFLIGFLIAMVSAWRRQGLFDTEV